jgi:hypothetical protein
MGKKRKREKKEKMSDDAFFTGIKKLHFESVRASPSVLNM